MRLDAHNSEKPKRKHQLQQRHVLHEQQPRQRTPQRPSPTPARHQHPPTNPRVWQTRRQKQFFVIRATSRAPVLTGRGSGE
jgi:hypothetical protein